MTARLSALALLALFAGPARAQTVRPGDAGLDSTALQPGVARFVVRVTSPMQQDVGTLVETTTLAGGRLTRVMRMAISMGNQAQTDSVVAVWPGLAPVFSSSTRGGGAVKEVRFSGATAATRVVAAGGAATEATVALPEPVFGGGWGGTLIAALPLAAGYTATCPTLDAGDGIVNLAVSVTGSETVQTPAGPVEAWTVAVERAGKTTRYAISKLTRETLAMRMSPQPGVEIEMVPAP